MVNELERSESIAEAAETPDRRRPGRMTFNNPHLIQLLRQPAAPSVSTADAMFYPPREADSLAAARGIGLGALVGAVCWAVLAFGLWLLLHA
jgi:hypothetical protein